MRLRSSIVLLTVLVCVSAAAAQTLMPLPPFNNTYTGSVRGYYFEAPTDFTIVGLRVPDESGVGVQSVEVVRFDGGTPPPAFPGTTNAFVSLARFDDQPSANILPVNIPVATGEVIGLYGQCSNKNSYSDTNGGFATNVFGAGTTLYRSGMQATLASGPMANIWAEVGGDVARVEMWYIPEPATMGLLGLAGCLLLRRSRG